jgi:hypothetical protein
MSAWTSKVAALRLDRLAALAAGRSQAQTDVRPGLLEGGRYNLHERLNGFVMQAYDEIKAHLPESDHRSLYVYLTVTERIASLEALARGLDTIITQVASTHPLDAELTGRRAEVEDELAADRDRRRLIRSGLIAAAGKGGT